MIVSMFTAALLLLQPLTISHIQDRPNDAGDGLLLFMDTPADHEQLLSYVLYRKEADAPDSCWEAVLVGMLPLEGDSIVDGYDPDYPVEQGVRYAYRLDTVTMSGDTLRGDVTVSSVVPRGEFFNTEDVSQLVASILFIGLIFYYFAKARRGANMYLRPIAGIEAIDEAVGRATEMGKPILYVPGLSTISDVATIASLTILGRVARKVADYGTDLMVPNCDPIVYTVATESVKQAYIEAGRPDAYNDDSVFFMTTSQFPFVAGVNGIMMRDKPATNFYLGMFWAESLLLAETGSISGAIQIAGTDAVTQLPFFITTCDYTLIGEELYAASAYLGREPKQMAAIKGQDACKAIVMLLISLGIIMSILMAITGNDVFMFLREIMLPGKAG